MSLDRRLTLFRDYAERRWGEAVGKIALDLGVRCPNRALGGCIYCSPESFKPYYLKPGDSIPAQIAQGKAYLRRRNLRRFLAYFQQETSTAGDVSQFLPKFTRALEDHDCVGLVISTRPDYVYRDDLDQLLHATAHLADKLILFELGLQSAKEESLRFLNRNHTRRHFIAAAAAVQSRPRLELGVHLILGVPGENRQDMRRTVQFVAEQGTGHLKLHHLQIVKGTPLYDIFQQRPFTVPSSDQYLELLSELVPLIPRQTVIHRLWSTCEPRLLHRPRWNLPPHQLYQRLSQLLADRDVEQGQGRGP